MKVIAINEIIINKISCLVFGLDNGSILTLSYSNKIFQTQSFRCDHIKPVKLLCVSPCNKYLISSGDDCMIFIYHSFLMVNGEKC
jgi:WD40 repeat protein